MILYLTRHGQPTQSADDFYTPGDPKLSVLGQQQAVALGRRLKDMGFNGKILASPYYRTAQTANLIAEQLHSDFNLCPAMREYATENIRDFQGMTLKQLSKSFNHLATNAELLWPWWTIQREDTGDILNNVVSRMTPFFERLITDYGNGDVLLVGHGASVSATHYYFIAQHDPEHYQKIGHNWNCFLTAIKLTPSIRVQFSCNVDHLDDSMVTCNNKRREL
jgi:broad specificity phosphatase PhoE